MTSRTMTSWLEGELDRAAVANRDPGRPAIHRLNRAEYANAVRDLFGLEMDAHALLPAMLQRARGHLLFMSSIAGKTTVPGNPLYHATKFGLRGFAGGLRADLHGSGVGVSCIFPGFIRLSGSSARLSVRMTSSDRPCSASMNFILP